MTSFKSLVTVASVGLLWILSSAFAQSTLPFSSEPVRAKFKVRVESITLPEDGLVYTTVVLADELKISFMPPRNCSSSIQADQQKISFSSTQTQMGLTLRVVKNFSMPDDAAILARFHEIYKDAQIQPVTTVISSAGTGRSCDIRRVFKNANVMITRHAYIPFSGGCLEIVFTTDAASFRAQRFVFTWLMNSLKIESRPISE